VDAFVLKVGAGSPVIQFCSEFDRFEARSIPHLLLIAAPSPVGLPIL
jgi:hypothetical protein